MADVTAIDLQALDDEIVAHLAAYARHSDSAAAVGIYNVMRDQGDPTAAIVASAALDQDCGPEEIFELTWKVFECGFDLALQLVAIVSSAPLSIDVARIGETVESASASIDRDVAFFFKRLATEAGSFERLRAEVAVHA